MARVSALVRGRPPPGAGAALTVRTCR
jgi:hypothetical protein